MNHASPASPETTELAPGYVVSRLIKGGWQLAGGHGAIDRAAAIADMGAYLDAGITTFDCADIYTGVEELIGAFRDSLPRDGAAHGRLRVHTKFVPDLDLLGRLDRADVRSLIDRSAQRLRTDRIDLVQFHWWDYAIPRFVEVGQWLAELQREGRITLLGGTNFDAAHAAALFDAGVRLHTMQVQYSVLDSRPEGALAALCARTGMRLLCYGTLAGGFLGEPWLGRPDPGMALENRSLVKYKLIIDDSGGWDLFQAILTVLARIAQRHGTDIATIAARYVLDQPHVAGVIVGVRNRAHLDRHRGVTALRLTGQDRAELTAILARRNPLGGEVYELERDRNGRHGRIMKYDLGK
ncbi:MAG TPA: aldo/keto reductase [Acetobacteraceae bacterium]|nr:aldo/keto reductase [Acetobacteraceae bacterium]